MVSNEKEQEKGLGSNWKSCYTPQSDYRPGIDYRFRIVVLINAGVYFFDHVVIIVNTEINRFQLIIVAKKKVALKKDFLTLRGAKIDFLDRFQDRCKKPDEKPQWTAPYHPEKKFFEIFLAIKNIQKKINEV